ncbi:MAG: phosphopantetheine-binding protein [Segniliparus sp.]|uniref:phosphopantetheine-binding protein n=1 Tax=Segniliparus sp. TaxID=2804064 RepID=UPI003F376490
MSTPLTYDEVHDVVRQHLVEVLGVDDSEVTPSTALTDLGAESLDIVEFRRNLESELGLLLPRRNVLGVLVDELGGSDRVYDQNGRISDLAADVLHRSAFGYTDEEIPTGAWPHEVVAAMTSAHWAAIAHRLLNQQPQLSGDELLVADVRKALAELGATTA